MLVDEGSVATRGESIDAAGFTTHKSKRMIVKLMELGGGDIESSAIR